MLENAYIIPLLPLAAFAVILFFGRWLPMEGAWLGIAAALYGLVHSVGLVVGIYTGQIVLPYEGFGSRFFESSVTWFSTGLFRVEAGMLIDGLSALMLMIVTLISFLVQVYSLGYQHGKPRFGRYYAYISLFTAAMLLLTIANNFFQLLVGWEIVGLCSYLLIGFEFERPEAAYAGRKAFITTKVGDLGMYLGLLILMSLVGTFNFAILEKEHVQAGLLSPELACVISLLLFCGAIGKSAQVPLHVWLPDAMEGPTPVSALIHAATMVAAGVFLVARVHFLFALSDVALSVVAGIGVLTALVAALNALVANDIKRVLAFSTVSQLGYMMLALGVGSPQAGMFHLTTHAFFKALLFLGAGSVIHAVHTNDIWRMGGLSKKMPITFLTFACATLAIIGFPLSSGFYSKEAILAATLEKHHLVLFVLASFTAMLTAFYMCRILFVAFLGDPRDPHLFAEAHESGPTMTLPLAILGILSLTAGFFFTHVWPFDRWVPSPETGHQGAGPAMAVSLLALVLGGGAAWAMYRRGEPDPARLAKEWGGTYRFLLRRWTDELYLQWIEKFIYAPARALARFDYDLLDQVVVDGFAWVARQISRLKRWFDDVVLDGMLVNGVGFASQTIGAGARLLQTGFAQFYLLVVAFGLSLLVLWALRAFG